MTDTVQGPGPGSLLHRYCNQARWGLAAVRASVLEAAHPQIGAALAEHSTFTAHPWRRLRNTVLSTQRLVDADERVRRREAARLNRLHARISGTDARGRRYDATDPEARAWVIATLFESTVMMCRLGGDPLDRADQERLYAEFRALLAFLGGDGGHLPDTLGEFWVYYDDMITGRLEDTEAARAILYRLFAAVPAPPLLGDHPAAWAAVRVPAGALATAITMASLPEAYRRRAGLPAPPGSPALMYGAYLAAGLATRGLPESWTRVGSVVGVLDAGPGALEALLRRAGTPPGRGGPARRSAALFFTEVLDQTGNGTLYWPDLAAMAREIATRLDLDGPAEERLFAAYAAWWRELLADLDADGDGSITAQEYATAATALPSPALIKVAEALFDAADADGDQSIDAEEYRALFRTAFRHDPGAAGDRLSRSAFVREFLAFMAGRGRSASYDSLFSEA